MNEQIRAAIAATVRVEGGSGVVLRNTASSAAVIATAKHVVPNGTAGVRWQGGQANARVVAVHPTLDIALVDAPRAIESRGLEIADAPEVAEAGWLLGFPTGWEGADALVTRCTTAGILPTTAWIDASATWGHSGGPVIEIRGGQPVVVGIILGDPGKVHEDLARLALINSQNDRLVNEQIAQQRNATGTNRADFGMLAMFFANFGAALDLIRTHFRAGYIEVALGRDVRSVRGE